MARPNPAVLQVFLFRDGEFLGTEMFSERQVSVGRDPDVADLLLESTQISRQHAIIEHDGAKVSIRDAGFHGSRRKARGNDLGLLDAA